MTSHTSTTAMGLLSLALCMPHAQAAEPAQGFSEIVALSAQRLDISRQVALTKWDGRLPVADPPNDPREKEVIEAAAREAARSGLDGDVAVAFFADQIEASKLVQFALMAQWRRSGSVPAEPRADLKTQLRPALDQLRSRFIQALIAVRPLREAPDCKAQLLAATSDHVRRRDLPTLYAIALDRGLARVCGD